MMMTITVREQIEQALRRVPNLDAFMLNQVRAELYREFDPYAVATTLTASFDDLARQMNYVKLDPDKVQVRRKTVKACLDILADCGCKICKRQIADLTAALEGKP